ncbi:MAG: OmpA family protein [Elusimicrobia bacterium]|nr:OmpA family protein [Elusimicrobiota bacterium]
MPEDRSFAARRLVRRVLLALMTAVPAAGQLLPGEGARVSKQMRMAIDLYRRGDDLEAMDRFMEVLVKGDPAERGMANEYLNRITHRMATGAKIETGAPVGATSVEPAAPVGSDRRAPVGTIPPEPASVRGGYDQLPQTPSDRELPPLERTQGGPSDERRVMKEEIDAKIKNRTREVLGVIKRLDGVTVRMANSRLPRAIGFKSSLIFGDAVRFKKDAGKLLSALSELVFTLGATQVVILPEGALFNDAKIMDMRRTMAVSASMMKAGVAPARLRVNLLSNQVDVPRDLSAWRGVLILFQYNQPLNLAADSEAETDAGPPVSLGVSPASLDPREGEGVIVEFSVMEPPTGLMSWRFQLFGPGPRPEDDMVVLQEVKGGGPVFHQIFWNGRKRYFGESLQGGRYECVLTATDRRNRTQRARAWVELKGAPPPPAAVAKAPPVAELDPEDEPDIDKPAPSSRVRGRTISSKAKSVRGPKSRKGKPARVKRRKPALTASAATVAEGGDLGAVPDAAPEPARGVKGVDVSAKPAPSEDSGGHAGAVNYQVLFQRGTTAITKEGEGILARVADTMHYYPLDNINLVGYAYTGEPDSGKLAARRAEFVSKLLVERHGMKADRIRVKTEVSGSESFKVEIYIVEGTQ